MRSHLRRGRRPSRQPQHQASARNTAGSKRCHLLCEPAMRETTRFRPQTALTRAATSQSAELNNGSRFAGRTAAIPCCCFCTAVRATSPIPGLSYSSPLGKSISRWCNGTRRGAGRTLRKTGRAVARTMTVDRMTKDGIELAEYLRKRLGKDKIVVVAHSFGTILGLGMVRARPELFYAYVGTGQVADEIKNYSAAYDALLQKAQAAGNQQAIDELKRVGPPPYPAAKGTACSESGRTSSKVPTGSSMERLG